MVKRRYSPTNGLKNNHQHLCEPEKKGKRDTTFCTVDKKGRAKIGLEVAYLLRLLAYVNTVVYGDCIGAG